MAKRTNRQHTFKITVAFDKPCSASHALREVRDTIHGEFYPTEIEPTDPGVYRVKRIVKFGKER